MFMGQEYWSGLLFPPPAMTNLDSTIESTLPTKVPRVKAMVFPVVMYG